MPAIRKKLVLSRPASRKVQETEKQMIRVNKEAQDLSETCEVEYPFDESKRASFRTSDGKKVTPHQWAVYDFARTIPCGRVTTYKDVCVVLGQGSPRSGTRFRSSYERQVTYAVYPPSIVNHCPVGSALRHNPFAPFVPCHRVIASNTFIGGFFGEWGTGTDRNSKSSGTQCRRKMEMLAMEGIAFTSDGYLADKNAIWRG
ncbi:hypothetical protein F5I97DRAFT_470194 [Phlebopus sp. FC_14]|nr:hypothetical protein F5I97DRAFT_470194 [Phlebopus sp. FC_14]